MLLMVLAEGYLHLAEVFPALSGSCRSRTELHVGSEFFLLAVTSLRSSKDPCLCA